MGSSKGKRALSTFIPMLIWLGKWDWKKVLKTRDKVEQFLTCWNTQVFWKGKILHKFSVKTVWKDLRMVAPKVAWYALTWEHYCVLRHSLVSWLVIKDRIYTRDKLKLCGKVSDHSCVLCSRGHESRNQLFFMYVFQDSFAELLATSSGAVHGVLSV